MRSDREPIRKEIAAATVLKAQFDRRKERDMPSPAMSTSPALPIDGVYSAYAAA